jgi:hypothetical protein
MINKKSFRLILIAISLLTSGIYFCKMQAGEYIETKKMLMIK